MPSPNITAISTITPAAAGLQTSTVGEPSLCAIGNEVLFSGNWYAAHSSNAGTAWSGLDPYSFFPPVAGGFCCDQTLIAVPHAGLVVWLLQYTANPNSNVLRVAFKSNNLSQKSGWKWWDLVPGAIDPAWASEWFDYNHAAISDGFLYVGTNMFQNNSFKRAVLFRIPISAFQPGAQLQLEHFATSSNFSLRCVQGAGPVMYFASHEGGTGRKLRVFSWPDNSPTITSNVVSITAWSGLSPYGPVGPGTSNWIGRCDGRITGAWRAGGKLGFMWSANKQSTQRPFPFIRVVRIDEATKALVDEPDIWNSNHATAYPEACPNSSGDVAVTLFAGGGAVHPTHLVGVRTASAATWKFKAVKRSTHSPAQDKWGDYLTCRPDPGSANGWIAAGYTLQGGGGIANIQPHLVRFTV
jgi:hypothetical protein